MTTYSTRTNAIRAARKALGAEAKPDQDFTITADGDKFAWAPLTAPEAPSDGIPAFLRKADQQNADPGPASPETAAATLNANEREAARTIRDQARVLNVDLPDDDLQLVERLRRLMRQPRRARPAGETSKKDIVAGLLRREKGTTAAEILEATGWPSVSVPQQARSAGLTLRTEKEGRTTRYYGTPAS